jgi:hypothetical protein
LSSTRNTAIAVWTWCANLGLKALPSSGEELSEMSHRKCAGVNGWRSDSSELM